MNLLSSVKILVSHIVYPTLLLPVSLKDSNHSCYPGDCFAIMPLARIEQAGVYSAKTISGQSSNRGREKYHYDCTDFWVSYKSRELKCAASPVINWHIGVFLHEINRLEVYSV